MTLLPALPEAENVSVRVLSVSCPFASVAFLAILAVCKINNLPVINMREWFKSTPATILINRLH